MNLIKVKIDKQIRKLMALKKTIMETATFFSDAYRSNLTHVRFGGFYPETIERMKKSVKVIDKNGKRKQIKKRKRIAMWRLCFGKNDKGTCYVCGKNVKITNFTIAHVKAVAKGGDNGLSNLRISCQKCNSDMGMENLYDYKNRLTKKRKIVTTLK